MFNTYIWLLLCMIFLHIIDDYKLQAGVLNCLKQKKWWRDQPEYKDLYKNDYVIGLIMHSFSWSFMIMLPIAFELYLNLGWLFLLYPINMIIHAIVDDLKANKGKINLITDQIIHIVQILITWSLFILYR